MSEIRDFLFFLLSRTSILPHFAVKGKWGFCFIKSKRKTKKEKNHGIGEADPVAIKKKEK